MWQNLTLSDNIGEYLMIYQYMTSFDKNGHYSAKIKNNQQGIASLRKHYVKILHLSKSYNIWHYQTMWQNLTLSDNIGKYLTIYQYLRIFDKNGHYSTKLKN